MTDKPTTRKDLMKPVQLLGLAFVAALRGLLSAWPRS